MKNQIQLLKNNDKREWLDLEWIEEFYRFLQGAIPESVSIAPHNRPKMTKKQAFTVIWYLQEHFPLLPDNIEQCFECKELFDTHCSGLYWETKGRHYCDGCSY